MKTVHKYTLNLTARQEIQARKGVIVAGGVDDNSGKLCLWASVDTDDELTTRTIVIVGTGHELPEGDLHYVATIQDRVFVWHIYEDRSGK